MGTRGRGTSGARTWHWRYGISVILCFATMPSVPAAQTIPAAITLPPSINFATSPNPVGSGARAVGQGTAFIAVADDATAASHNPAGLIQLELPELSLVASRDYFRSDVDVNVPDLLVEDARVNSTTLNYASVATPIHLWGRNVVAALNYQRLVSLDGETDLVAGFTSLSGTQTIHSQQEGELATFTPALAVQVTPRLSVGVACNFWVVPFAHNGWRQATDITAVGLVPSGNALVPFDAAGTIDDDYRVDSGFNAHLGLSWQPTAKLTVGAVLRTPARIKLKHRATSNLTVTLPDAVGNPRTITTRSSDVEHLDLDLPLSYGAGLAWRFSDVFTASVDVFRTRWSGFEMEESSIEDPVVVENGAPTGRGTDVLAGQGDDTTSVRLGCEYLWIGERVAVPLRAGLFYDPEPAGDGTDDFWGGSVGSGVAYKQWIFDAAYQYRTGTQSGADVDSDVEQHLLLLSLIVHLS
jgi:long-subunit fatty acid transport protein